MHKSYKFFLKLFVILLTLLLAISIAIPEGSLKCDDQSPDVSPDGEWSISVCRRPMLFGMPGGGSDASAWIVLRDKYGSIRGVSDLNMIQNYGLNEIQWGENKVKRLSIFELNLSKTNNGFIRFFEDRIWRIRALFNITKSNEDFY